MTAWSALGSVRVPEQAEAAVVAGISQLDRPPAIEGPAEALDLTASLRDADPHNARAASVSSKDVALVRHVPSARSSLLLTAPSRHRILVEVATWFTTTQIVALLHVVEARRAETPTETTT